MLIVEHYETREVRVEKNSDGSVRELKVVPGSEKQGLILKSSWNEVRFPLTPEQLDQYISLLKPRVERA